MPITQKEIKVLKSLQTKKGRKQTGCFIAEGVRLLEEAFRHRNNPEKIYFARDSVGERGQFLINKMGARKVALIEIKNKELLAISATETPQGLLAVFKQPEVESGELFGRIKRNVLWCENISDPGNMGTLLRSALAFNFKHIIISGQNADVFSPKVIRSSAGAIFRLKFWISETDKILTYLKDRNIKLIATDIRGEALNKTLSFDLKSDKLAVAVGSEANGLSDEIVRNSDALVKIEQTNEIESLNVSVAGAIVMSNYYKSE